jgi:hypothetical protein
MRHHADQCVAGVILRAGTEHPVIEVLVLCATFEAQGSIVLRFNSEGKIFEVIVRISSLRRVGQKAPILLCREWIEVWTIR